MLKPSRLFPVFAAFMLAACPLAQDPAAPPPVVAAVPAPPRIVVAPPPIPTPAAPEETELALAIEPPPPIDHAAVALARLEGFIGRGGDYLNAELGSPDYRRREESVEVWQYRFQSCVVDFVIDRAGGITTWDGRGRSAGAQFNPASCGAEMARRAGN